MLVLSQEPGDEVAIGKSIVKVLRLESGTVRMGVQAPKDQQITRLHWPCAACHAGDAQDAAAKCRSLPACHFHQHRVITEHRERERENPAGR